MNVLFSLSFLMLVLPVLVIVLFALRTSQKQQKQQADEQRASIEQLLFQWGFKRASWFEQMNLLFSYKNTDYTPPIYVSLKNLPHGDDGQLLGFLVFFVEMPLKGNLFIRTPGLEREQNDVLDETYWDRAPSEALAPLGLFTLCALDNRAELEQRLRAEPVQRMLANLMAQKDQFYIYGDAEYGFLKMGFALPRSLEPQRIRRWLDTVSGFTPVLHDPNRQGRGTRDRLWVWLLMLLVPVCMLLSLFLLIPLLARAS